MTRARPMAARLKKVRHDDAFLQVFKWKASPVEGQSMQQKDKKRRKRKAPPPKKGIKRNEKPKEVVSKFRFLRMPEEKRHKPRC